MVLLKIIISNHISELLKMQLESRSRNVHTKGIRFRVHFNTRCDHAEGYQS